MDTYEINSKGFISFRQQTDDDYDRIYAADASSNYVDVGKDFIKSLNSREANSTSIDIYSSTDDLNDVFSFVKDNTIVEWSLINTTTDKGRQNYLGTSHYESSDSSGDVVLKKMLSDDSIILQHTHSHPGYSFVVSPADVDFAEDIQERFPNAKMYIAIPGTSELREYNRDTQAAVLPDLIIIR
jgi:proteasome lid subunit RPN8/RPN11